MENLENYNQKNSFLSKNNTVILNFLLACRFSPAAFAAMSPGRVLWDLIAIFTLRTQATAESPSKKDYEQEDWRESPVHCKRFHDCIITSNQLQIFYPHKKCGFSIDIHLLHKSFIHLLHKSFIMGIILEASYLTVCYNLFTVLLFFFAINSF